MSNPLPADSEPIPEGLVAAVDETVAELQGGVTYVLAAVIFGEAGAARKEIQALTADRTRPFHWHREGPTNRSAAVKLLSAHAITTTILAQRAGRHAQTETRAALLAQLVIELADDGVGHLIIESRGQREDGRDRAVILNCFREHRVATFNYDWRTKAEPLLWYPDAMAGVARAHVTDGRSASFDFLQRTLTLTEVRYVRQRAPSVRKPRLPS